MPKIDLNKTFGIVNSSTNQKLINDLKSKDVELIEFPMLRHEIVLLDDSSRSFIENIDEFDWLIFTDVLAVDYFLEILTERDFDLFKLDHLRVCAFGEAVSDHLRFVQLHSDVIPGDLDETFIFEQIRNYIADADELQEAKFLIMKGGFENSAIGKKLKDKNIDFEELSVYSFEDLDTSDTSKLKTLIIGGAIDEIIFTSPIDLLVLKRIFKGVELRNLLRDVGINAKDLNTFQNLKENAFSPRMFSPK